MLPVEISRDAGSVCIPTAKCCLPSCRGKQSAVFGQPGRIASPSLRGHLTHPLSVIITLTSMNSVSKRRSHLVIPNSAAAEDYQRAINDMEG